ncbi:AMP-binding protein [Streptomyces sp. XY006]|uniref:AMP-binding protein n=1 Tax=Streptomyces sp. XY006 TaxID=2021410 RepID=UPI00211ABC3B|nr:AMP-binding protein [Streptomyces sp. XY006]
MRSFSASSAHKGMWLAQKMAPDMLNHALAMWEVDGELDTPVMDAAMLRVLQEAEVLRVGFVDDGGGLRMVPRELGDWRPFHLDLSGETDPEQAAREALARMVAQPYDLERDLLFRLGVVTLTPARSLVVISYHHLVSDGYGAGGLLSRRIAEVYTALVRGSQVPEPGHPWDVASYAALAEEYTASGKADDDAAFWREHLADAPPPAQVPGVPLSDARRARLSEPLSGADRWSEVAGAIGMVSRTLTVPRAEADAWTETAKSLGVWMSSLLTAAAAVFLRHRCDRPEFLLSLAVGNRAGAAGRTPGLAVNVVPLRMSVPLGASFARIADAVVDETYEVFGQTGCHYSDIQRACGTVLSGRGSFGAVLNVVDFVEQLRFGGLPARYFSATTGTFDELSIGFCTDGTPDSDLFLRLDAPADLYSRAELRAVGEDLLDHVRAVLAAPAQTPVGALAMLRGPERHRPQAAANEAGTPLPGLTVPELFDHQAARAPGAVAMVSGDTTVTYGELAERSGHLARALRGRHVGPETVVAVAVPRSVDLAVALLGVARAGGAYLPVDPAAPAQGGIAGAPGVLLTDAATAAALPADPDLTVLLLDELCAEAGDDGTGTALPPPYPDQLLAVLPGPGPDGSATEAAVTHRTMERFVLDRNWREGAGGTVLWHAPPTAGAAALDIWAPLLHGGRIVLAPPGELDADALPGLCETHGITTVRLTADAFSALAAHRPERLAGLREVWTGGDRVPPAAVRRVREACPDLTVVDVHGPVEAASFALRHPPAAEAPGDPAHAYGSPLDHTALHVLGPGLVPVPPGVAGELYLAGPGVARGRPGRPGQTAAQFVPCPFGPPGARMYRTGHRVRRDEEGRFAYVGRAGAQADVRGFRIEPAEVEEVLSEHPGLARVLAEVTPDGAGQRRLVAYVVPGGAAAPTVEELRAFAAGRLPEAMVPSVFVVLDRLPVTADGRTDRAALPEPPSDGDSYRAPRNHTERVLAGAFADVLEVERVGIDDDFFDIGGNSLRAIRLVGLIRAELNQEVSIRKLFAARTIAGLSDLWGDVAPSSRPALRRRTKDGRML